MPHRSPATPTSELIGLAYSAFARHYLRNLCWFLFLQVLRCFTSLGIASNTYGFSIGCQNITPDGLPHSDISGSMLVCSSPKLFAAYHVLLRQPMPRHPSCALSSLTTKKLVKVFPLSRKTLKVYCFSQHKLLCRWVFSYSRLFLQNFLQDIFFNCQSTRRSVSLPLHRRIFQR